MQQEGAEFNPNEGFPKELKDHLKIPENSMRNVNTMTPMAFDKGGAGNNFLGISPIINKEGGHHLDGGTSSKKSSMGAFSVSYQQH